jgi:hypothetical protein
MLTQISVAKVQASSQSSVSLAVNVFSNPDGTELRGMIPRSDYARDFTTLTWLFASCLIKRRWPRKYTLLSGFFLSAARLFVMARL